MDCLKPKPSVLAKIGSIIVHIEEIIDHGHAFDVIAMQGLLKDSEIQEWLGEMRKFALIPEKRDVEA
jgi:hypothetical protein